VNPAFLPFKLLASIPHDEPMDAEKSFSSGSPIRAWGTRHQVPEISFFYSAHNCRDGGVCRPSESLNQSQEFPTSGNCTSQFQTKAVTKRSSTTPCDGHHASSQLPTCRIRPCSSALYESPLPALASFFSVCSLMDLTTSSCACSSRRRAAFSCVEYSIFFLVSTCFSFRSYSFRILAFSASTNCSFSMLNSCKSGGVP
jgi:hypothetical protein